MAIMDVRNSSEGWLALWLEPLGEDRWLKPGEWVRIESNYSGPDRAFSVEYWVKDDDRAAGIENVTVWDECGDCYATTVTDSTGEVVECGHQRPQDVSNRWMGLPSDLQKPVTE